MSNSTAPDTEYSFARLLEIVKELREKCPWDKKQTIDSLRVLTLEEVYELSDAILNKDFESLKKELGDVLLHVIFYSVLGEEKKQFNIDEVIEHIIEKLIRRHPHIYGDVKVEDDTAVKKNWEKIKISEGEKSVMSGVPKSAPPMLKAVRIQEKASAVGFDWNNKEQVWQKVREEVEEFEKEIRSDSSFESNDNTKKEEEFGDILFSLINYSRHIDIDPIKALEVTNKKFINRFQFMEKQCWSNDEDFSEMPIHEMEKLWEKSKREEF